MNRRRFICQDLNKVPYFQKVEYIESDGAQWLILPVVDFGTVEMDVDYTSFDSFHSPYDRQLNGLITSGNDYYGVHNAQNPSPGKLILGPNNVIEYSPVNNRTLLRFRKEKRESNNDALISLYANGQLLHSRSSSNVTSGDNFVILSLKKGDGSYGYHNWAKLYGVKAWNADGELVVDGIPACIKQETAQTYELVGCIYNKVDNSIIENSGGRNFKLGPVIT